MDKAKSVKTSLLKNEERNTHKKEEYKYREAVGICCIYQPKLDQIYFMEVFIDIWKRSQKRKYNINDVKHIERFK